MPAPSRWTGPRPGRVLGLYALATMDREGPVYGYLLAERIAERTDGGWRPGPGAIYPALAALTARGLSRLQRDGRRRLYSITPAGRRALAQVRRDWMGSSRAGPDLSRLWSEIAGEADVRRLLLRRLHRTLESIAAQLEREPPDRGDARPFLAQVGAELSAAQARVAVLRSRGRLRPGTPPRRAR
jgi:DNA-binding PadR family transcriptional regulator